MEMSVTAATAAAPCAECGRTYSPDNMIRYQHMYICATCKPLFMQKLSEGATVNTGEFRYGGFWIRVASTFIDGLILMVFNFLLLVVAAGQTAGQVIGIEERTGSMFVVAQLVGFVVGVAYETVLIGRFGATLGKMACGLRVVNPEGGNISYARAFGRYLAKVLGILTLYIGYIIAAFDGEKRSLHDRICNTRVVYK